MSDADPGDPSAQDDNDTHTTTLSEYGLDHVNQPDASASFDPMSTTDAGHVYDETPDTAVQAALGDDSSVITQVPLHDDSIIRIDDVFDTSAYRTWDLPNGTQATPSYPSAADGSSDADSAIVGDVDDANFWFQQNTAYTCGPASATQIIEDFTGYDYKDETEVARWAANKGLLTERGMTPENLATTLSEWGVPSTVAKDQDFDDIAEYLREGRSVVMFVDAFDYWPGTSERDEAEDSDQDVENHFIRIVAVDENRQVAILADPGHPDGAKMEVPLDQLEEAWDDVTGTDPTTGQPLREKIAIVSRDADPTPGGGPDDFSDTSSDDTRGSSTSNLFSNVHGWVLIPVAFAAARVFASVRHRAR